MGSKSAPSPPTPVDPTKVAAAQTSTNEATALNQSQLNNTNIQGPYGTISYTHDPASNQWTQATNLSPAEQGIFNQGTQAQSSALGIANTQLGNVANALNTPLSAPSMQTGYQTGAIQNGYSPGGSIATGFNQGQPVQGSVASAGQINNSYDQGGQIQGQIGPSNFGDAVGNTVNSAYNQQMQLLAPQQQAAQQHQDASLIAQGLNPNDAAFQNSTQLFNNGQATQRAQVAANAVGLGNAEQNTLFGQQATQGQFANQAQAQQNAENAAQAGFGNTAQGQQYGQNLSSGQFANTAAGQQYAQNQGAAQFGNTAQAQQNTQNQGAAAFGNTAQQQAASQAASNAALNNSAQQANFTNTAYAQQLPINEFTALMGSNQVSAPQAANGNTSVAPTDVTGAYALQAQQQQQAYQAQMANYQSGLGGLFNLGGAALQAGATYFSDARLKRNLIRTSKTLAGFPVYAFRYLWDSAFRLGVLAQDVLATRPDAVRLHPSGYLMVDYDKLGAA